MTLNPYKKPKLNRYEMTKQKNAEKQRNFMKTVMWISLYSGGIGVAVMIMGLAAMMGALPK